MNGTIIFGSISELAEFLKEFAGSTAVFEVHRYNDRSWILTFTGGF